MKLYSFSLSPYAARVRGAIYAKSLPIEILEPPQDWRDSESFRKLNPLMKIPVLVLDDGAAIGESAVIVEYLEDIFPAPSLRPADAKERARMRMIAQVADLYVMQALMPIFYLMEEEQSNRAAIQAQFEKLDQGLARLELLLAGDGYALGNGLSLADLWLAPVRFTLGGLRSYANRPLLLKAYPKIDAYEDLIHRDPHLDRVWREMEEGLKAFMAARAATKIDTP